MRNVILVTSPWILVCNLLLGVTFVLVLYYLLTPKAETSQSEDCSGCCDIIDPAPIDDSGSKVVFIMYAKT